MIGLVLVAHAHLAAELLTAAELIVGPIPQAEALGIGPGDDGDTILKGITVALKRLGGDGVIIMTDMFGGTPSNISLSFLGTHPVEVLTGVNLPMMVKFPYARQSMTLSELAHHLQDCGQRNITIPGDMLKKSEKK